MKFYDTCALLNLLDNAFEEDFYISSVTLKEIENIKTSYNKDSTIKYQARRLANLLLENENKYKVISSVLTEEQLTKFELENNNDNKIIYDAYSQATPINPIYFMTMDLCAYHIAKQLKRQFPNEYFEICYPKIKNTDNYTGFKTFYGTPDDLVGFYQNLSDGENHYDMLINEYMIIFDKDTKEALDYWKWTEGGFVQVPYSTAESRLLGKTKPLDAYQRLAFDSLKTNQLTVLRGRAGSGKSWIAISYLFQQLEKGKIDKIIIFCNNIAVKDAGRLGWYPGSKDEKLLDSQTGHFLAAKLGDITHVERLIDEGVLELLPISDIRGFDTSGMRAGVYFTEAQNATSNMIKLMLQRIGEDSIVIFEGDTAQTDMPSYEQDNGLIRMSEVFRGEEYYGEITLQNCHRSKIADRAELMC